MIAGALAQARAAVSPQTYTATLSPGETVHVTKSVFVPESPRKLDIFLLVDNTGSYSDDLPRMKALSPGIFDSVRAVARDSYFGLATFADIPFDPWGSVSAGDYGFLLNQQLTESREAWVAAVNAMRSRYGVDGPESQYEALYQLVTGEGLEMPISADGDYDDRGEIPPGMNAQFRINSSRVIAITTDSEFHDPGDSGPFPYPGHSRDAVVAALNAAGVRVVAIKAPGSTLQMDDLANATGGAVTTTDSSSTQIAQAILAGLTSLDFDVTGGPFSGCDPLDITLTPPSRTSVPGGSTVTFDEAITVPADVTAADLPSDRVVRCTMRFTANGAGIGVESVTITVNQPPDCSGVSASPDSLTPPNHAFRTVTLAGATDPDGDPLTITIKAVTQDEPVNAPGDGNTTPDAQAGATAETVQVRSERSASGDGRVYAIDFEVSDGRGGVCTGTSYVGVPKDQGGSPTPVDSGQRFDSFSG